MQLVVLAPSAPPVDMPPAPLEIDPSDTGTLAWLDLDRTEVGELPRLVPEIPASIGRELLDPSPVPQLRERGGLRWLSLLAVSKTDGTPGLVELDVLFGPGFMVTVHSGDRPSLQRLARSDEMASSARSAAVQGDPGTPPLRDPRRVR